MEKKPFVTLEQLKEIEKTYPTPYHIYDEKGFMENARKVNEAFSWNKGFREYFAVKAEPNPFIIKKLKEVGCGVDCSSYTELMIADKLGFRDDEIMFSSNETPEGEFGYCAKLGGIINLDDIKLVGNHNLQNIMIAICIAKKCDVKNEIINQEIASFIGVEHRIEFVKEINGIKIYNDSKATNTDASIIALKAFKQPVILLMGGFDKGLDLKEMSTYSNKIKRLVTFGAAGKRFKDEMHVENSICVKNLKEATLEAINNAIAGDIVLLSPSTSSFDEFSGYEQRGNVFKEIVCSLDDINHD